MSEPRIVACPHCGARVAWTPGIALAPVLLRALQADRSRRWASEAYRVPAAEAPRSRRSRTRRIRRDARTSARPAATRRGAARRRARRAQSRRRDRRAESAQREHRQRRLGDDRGEAVPAERRRARVRRRRAAPGPAPRSRGRARRRARCSARVWQDARAHQIGRAATSRRASAAAVRCTPSHPHARAERRVAVSSTFAPRGRASATSAAASARWRSTGQSFSRSWISCKPRSSAALARARETPPRPDRPPCVMPYTARQQQRAQHERVRGQQRRDVEVARRLPRERLPVVPDRLAVPFEHAEEMELDVRVRIAEALHEPRRGAAHVDAELLGELAVERCARRLARLELAAGKFPVARVGFAGRPLREQHAAVRRAR